MWQLQACGLPLYSFCSTELSICSATGQTKSRFSLLSRGRWSPLEAGGVGAGGFEEGVCGLPAMVNADGEFPLECHWHALIFLEDYLSP